MILHAVDELQGADTNGIDPTLQVGDPGTPTRPDAVEPCLSVDRALAGAPSHEAGFLRVAAIQ